MSEVI